MQYIQKKCAHGTVYTKTLYMHVFKLFIRIHSYFNFKRRSRMHVGLRASEVTLELHFYSHYKISLQVV